MNVATLSRLSLLALVVGVLLGDIFMASAGLAGLCGAAVYLNVLQDTQAQEPQDEASSGPPFFA
ncbi:hypothetical protein [Pseudomonas entomophila]|uniref:Uncharacterized protein n=2 Tax=Pseudomonas entomophila TaxID=312306 RepID=Q1IA37_PSEE4|nr:hypothetical protein [Pseudomonas entomophila]WMW03760.1 hypothetical protein RAH46_15590 [Pseudomonas entomophila]CAK15484.1 hypothetical protein; putative signal peptide [Pseudomonas entomophila L48]